MPPRIHAVGILVIAAVSACSSGGTTPQDDCVSHYIDVAHARTWRALQDEMLARTDLGSVVSLRTQARGHDVGSGPRSAVRVVDLLNGEGMRVLQVEIWRTGAGSWAAGAWGQCTD